MNTYCVAIKLIKVPLKIFCAWLRWRRWVHAYMHRRQRRRRRRRRRITYHNPWRPFSHSIFTIYKLYSIWFCASKSASWSEDEWWSNMWVRVCVRVLVHWRWGAEQKNKISEKSKFVARIERAKITMVGLDVCHTIGARDTVKTMAQRRRCMRCKTNLLSSTVVRVSFLAWAHIIEVRRLNRVKFSFFFFEFAGTGGGAAKHITAPHF